MTKEPKVVYTWRTHQKPELQAFAKQDNRTVSNLVNLAVKEFLIRRGLLPSKPSETEIHE